METTFSRALGELKNAQKGRAKGAPGYSIYVNRKVGRYLAALAHTLGLSPNQVTFVSAMFTFSGIILLAIVPPSWGLAIAVWLLLALGYAWDSADGQVARLSGGGSVAGEWLDHFVDALKISSLHLAVLVGWYRYSPLSDDLWLLIPIGFAVVGAVTFFAMILNDLLKTANGVASAVHSGGSSPLRSFILLPTDYGVLCFAFIFWNIPFAFIGLYSVLALASAMFLALAARKWFLDMKAI